MIREANSGDCLNLAALSIQVCLNTYARDGIRTNISKYVLNMFTEDYFEEKLNQSKFYTLVYSENDHLIAYVVANMESCFEDEKHGYEIDTLYVQNHFKGRGIGKRLLSEIRSQCGSKHWLSAWIHNQDAIGFYKHLGFKDIGTSYFDLEGEQIENRVLAYTR